MYRFRPFRTAGFSLLVLLVMVITLACISPAGSTHHLATQAMAGPHRP